MYESLWREYDPENRTMAYDNTGQKHIFIHASVHTYKSVYVAVDVGVNRQQ